MQTSARSLLLLGCLGISHSATAACVPDDFTVSGEFERSVAVVRGKVIAVHLETSDDDGPFHTGMLYVVRVDERFKGDAWGLVPVYDENDSGRFTLEVGGRYVLSLSQGPKGFEATGCGNSGEVEQRGSAIAELRALAATPLPSPPRTLSTTKGVELYVWPGDTDGSWVFSLLPGTNRQKSRDEIEDQRNRIGDLVALKKRLAQLPPGTDVIWKLRYENMASPQDVVNDVAAFARAHSLRLTVVP